MAFLSFRPLIPFFFSSPRPQNFRIKVHAVRDYRISIYSRYRRRCTHTAPPPRGVCVVDGEMNSLQNGVLAMAVYVDEVQNVYMWSTKGFSFFQKKKKTELRTDANARRKGFKLVKKNSLFSRCSDPSRIRGQGNY